MGLIAWYPLNGDLKDYSGNYPDWENNNLVEYESGKIGKTYHFSSTEYGQLSTTGFVPEKDKEFSCAFWVKELSDYSQYGFRVVYQCGEFIIGQYQNHFNGYFTSGGCDIEGATVDFTKWNHCALTFTKDGLVTLYVNGKKHLSKQATAFPKAGSTYLGRRTTGGNNTYVDMYVNDLRIYDHCLSDTEVKEISKGLVLHYPLNSGYGNENLLIGTNKFNDGGNASGITSSTTEDNLLKVVATKDNGNWKRFVLGNGNETILQNTMNVGDKFVVSFDMKIESGSGIPFLFINEGNGYQQMIGDANLIGTWQRVYQIRTWKEPRYNLWIFIFSFRIWWIRRYILF